jgi:hypothetical protein
MKHVLQTCMDLVELILSQAESEAGKQKHTSAHPRKGSAACVEGAAAYSW